MWRSMHHLRTRIWIVLAFVGFVLNAWLLLSPSTYRSISNRIAWRWGSPMLAQVNFEENLETVRLRGDALNEPGVTIVFGDSHLQAIPSYLLGHRVANYSTAGQTAESLSRRIDRYPSLHEAGTVVLHMGENDLAQGRLPSQIAKSISQILDKAPLAKKRVVLLGILPASGWRATPSDRSRANELLRAECTARPSCTYLPSDFLEGDDERIKSQYVLGDGVHLSIEGYRYWLAHITPCLKADKPCSQK